MFIRKLKTSNPKKQFLLFGIILLAATLTIGFLTIIFSPSKQPKANSSTITWGSKIRSNPYRLHVEAGQQYSLTPYRSNAEIIGAYKKGKLSRVTNSRGLLISELTHSEPFLHNDAAQVLAEIGRDFYKRRPGNKLVINSLTRAVDTQRKLTATNANASPNTSSHSHAVSFDVAYSKFNRSMYYDHDCHRALEETLQRFQSQRKIYIIREKQSACYHVTVRPRSDWYEK